MTPEEARDLEPGTTPGPWHSLHEEWDDEDETPCERFCVVAGGDAILETIDFDPRYHDPKANTALAAAAPDMRATIAAQTWEWRAEIFEDGAWKDVWEEWWSDEEAAREDYQFITEHLGRTARLVRRPVGPVEVVEE